MTENFTAEDFAQASFARHEDGRKAIRFGIATDGPPWQIGMFGKSTDGDMARNGWVPVVEATEVMQNRQIDAEAHLDQIERLSKRLAAAGDQVENQRLVLEDLREENYRLERILQTPLSLKDLEAAWEAAEAPTGDAPIREGDVVIYTSACGTGVTVHKAAVGQFGRAAHGYVRILSRAPKREPWADLEDVLRNEIDLESDPGGIAHALYLKGWRKDGDDE